MKPKKLKKKIQELENRLREDSEKLGRLRGKLQQAETAKALKAARKSAARAAASAGKNSSEPTIGAKKPSSAKKAKRPNLSPERRAQLAAAMKARWAAKRAAEGTSTTPSDQSSPTPPTQPPDKRGDGV
jgi:hypothetical protein